jgi:hypothetical protein
METPTIVAYDSKVKLLFSIIIFNTCNEWMLHHDVFNVIYKSTYMDHGRRGSCMERMDFETTGLGTVGAHKTLISCANMSSKCIK